METEERCSCSLRFEDQTAPECLVMAARRIWRARHQGEVEGVGGVYLRSVAWSLSRPWLGLLEVLVGLEQCDAQA